MSTDVERVSSTASAGRPAAPAAGKAEKKPHEAPDRTTFSDTTRDVVDLPHGAAFTAMAAPEEALYKGAAAAAETPEQAEDALKAIGVEYEILEPVFDYDEALKEGAPVIHDEEDAFVPIPISYEPGRNIVARVGMKAGDFEKGMREADYTFDQVFETSYAQHCSMEGYISWARLDPYGRIFITTSTQVPFHTRRIVARILDVPVQKIRVIKPRIGGGFGSKQEMMLEDVVAMVAMRTGRPAFWALTRPEVFRSGRTRHPMRIRIRYGLKKMPISQPLVSI